MPRNQATILGCALAGLFALACVCVPARAAEPAKKVLVTNLENPSGLAIHGGTGDVFIATRYGWGLALMDDHHLVVGDGSLKDGEEVVRVYKLEAEGKEHEPIKEDAAAFTLGPIPVKEGVTSTGEGNFYGVAVGAGSIFVSCNGDRTKGWVARAEIADGKPGTLVPFIATKTTTNADAPGPLVFSPDGTELVVGQMGATDAPADSVLAFFDPKTGELKRQLKTELNDVAGLDYNPKSGKLYATDFSWPDPAKGALYELKVEGEAVESTKILDLDRPTALAFDKDGKLYVSTYGTKQEGSDKSPGQLIVVEGEL
jgi:DNA-binding beta-propeller fold protein YncE